MGEEMSKRDSTSAEEDQRQDDEEDDNPISSLEDHLAMINGKRGKNGQWQKRSPSARLTARPPVRTPDQTPANAWTDFLNTPTAVVGTPNSSA